SNWLTFSARVCTWASARRTLARSPPPMMREAAKATMPPMSTTTTMISMRLKPPWADGRGERLSGRFCMDSCLTGCGWRPRGPGMPLAYDIGEVVDRHQHRQDHHHHHHRQQQGDRGDQGGQHAVQRLAGLGLEGVGG